jgi:hypothetical protein
VSSAGSKIISEVGGIAQDVLKSTGKVVRGVSKSIAKIAWRRMYIGARKSVRVAARKSGRNFNRTLKSFRKTSIYNSVSNVPSYLNQISKVSKVGFKRFRKSTIASYKVSRKWILKNSPKIQSWVGSRSNSVSVWIKTQYPKVKSFVQDNYPRVEKFVLTQLPVYRAVFA